MYWINFNKEKIQDTPSETVLFFQRVSDKQINHKRREKPAFKSRTTHT